MGGTRPSDGIPFPQAWSCLATAILPPTHGLLTPLCQGGGSFTPATKTLRRILAVGPWSVPRMDCFCCRRAISGDFNPKKTSAGFTFPPTQQWMHLVLAVCFGTMHVNDSGLLVLRQRTH